MGVRKRVFGSQTERSYYYKLSRQWGDDYRLYHNLPYLSVIDASPREGLIQWADGALRVFHISDIEHSRLKKTSIDYTLCNKDDAPLLSIEFDGMQEGFNVGTAYHPNLVPSSAWRDEILGLKLRVAHGSMYPFFVLGSEQFRDISDRIRLMIVDGIIGEVLASQAARRRFDQGFTPDLVGMTQEEFDALGPIEQDEVVQDWVIGVEVETTMQNNPLQRTMWELRSRLEVKSWREGFVDHPSVARAKGLRERAKLLDAAPLQGFEAVLYADDVGEVSATVWLPNLKTPHFSGYETGEAVAMLTALDRLQRRRER